MKYIGNLPELNITHSQAMNWGYIQKTNPTVDVNPSSLWAKWLNAETCEEFICKDNAPGSNVWVGQLGTTVEPS